MKIFLLVLHIILVVMSTGLSVGNFKIKQTKNGSLWAITALLWLINIAFDVSRISS